MLSDGIYVHLDLKGCDWDFPGGTEAGTPGFQCRVLGFDSWSGN